MTVSTTTSTITYSGNGATTLFTFPFIGVAAADIEVLYTNASGVVTTLNPVTYTLVLNAASPGSLWGIGGSVTYPISGTPILAGTTITINRILPYTQTISISNQGGFYPQVVEQALDKLELQIQQVNTDADSALSQLANFSVDVTAAAASASSAAASASSAAASAASAAGYASTPTSAFRNRIINGNMRFNNRNASVSVPFTNISTYILDRWYGNSSSLTTQTIAGQRVTSTLADFINSLKFTVGGTGAAPAAGAYAFCAQAIEGVNVSDLLWGTASAKTITVSFRAKCSVTGTYGLTILNGASNRSYVSSFALTAGVDTAVSLTIPGDTTGTWTTDTGIGLYVIFDLGVGTTRSVGAGVWSGTSALGLTGGTKLIATTGATFEVSGVQVELGSVATSYEIVEQTAGLTRCQRYYWSHSYTLAEFVAVLSASTTLIAAGKIANNPVTMRAAPSVSVSGGFLCYKADQVANIVADSQVFASTVYDISFSSITANSGGGAIWAAGAAAWVASSGTTTIKVDADF